MAQRKDPPRGSTESPQGTPATITTTMTTTAVAIEDPEVDPQVVDPKLQTPHAQLFQKYMMIL